MNVPKINHCLFTDLRVQPLQRGRDAFEYFIEIDTIRHQISLNWDCLGWPNEPSFLKIKHILAGLLLNNKWVDNEDKVIHLVDLQNLLKERTYPSTPEQKLDNLFLELFKFQESEGEIICAGEHIHNNQLHSKLYFRTLDEYVYYFKVLVDQGLFEVVNYYAQSDVVENFKITFKGLTHAIKLQNAGELSNKCFVAMSFKPQLDKTRQAIKDAIIETGFTPILIDDEHLNSDTTINDGIIANLKKCRFCIADFTLQSKGVYFESGFALGQGKKVIYTCEKEDFEKAHFDIKPLQQILYETPEELKKKLIDKIEAWVK